MAIGGQLVSHLFYKLKIYTVMDKQQFTNKPKLKVEETISTEVYEQIFTLVTKNKQTQIAVSNYIVSKLTFDSVAKAKKYIDSKPWELIINASCCLSEINQQSKK